MQRWTAAIVWRVLIRNPWGYGGDSVSRREQGVKRLRMHMFEHFLTQEVPPGRRLGDLTTKMLGNEAKGLAAHPGCELKVKAAEVHVLMEWAMVLLQKHMQVVPFGPDLLVAGRALQEYLRIVKSAGPVLTQREHQDLMDTTIRHLTAAERALIHEVPKYHMWAHSSRRCFLLHGTVFC